MKVSWPCDRSLFALLEGQADPKLLNVGDLPDMAKTQIPQGRIISIERVYLKNRAFFVLTDCSSHPNFRQGSTQKPAKYKPHYTPSHRSFPDS